MAEASAEKFDAQAHMGSIKTRNGQQKYLAVKYRVMWIRSDYPEATIEVDKVDGGLESGWVEFRCTIALPNGARATDYASETQQDFPDYYEKAATKAIGRACATLGYGTDAAADFDDGEPLDGAGASKGERAARPNYPGQNTLPPGPGAARLDAKPERNAPRPQQQQQQERVAPPQIGKYGDHAPSGRSTNGAQVNEYLHANGFKGGNTGECIRELEQWVHETFHTDDKIIPTGPVNPQKPNYGPGTLPCDIYDYAFHFFSQYDVDEEATAAVTAVAGGVHLPDDQVPF